MKIAKGVREANKAIVVDARAVQMSREAEFKDPATGFLFLYIVVRGRFVGALGTFLIRQWNGRWDKKSGKYFAGTHSQVYWCFWG